MRIRTWVNSVAAVSVTLSISAAFAVGWFGWSAARQKSNAALAGELHRVHFERMGLRDQYLLYGMTRATRQWHGKTEDFARLLGLASAQFGGAVERATIDAIREDFEDTRSIMERLFRREDEALSKTRGSRFADEGARRLVGQVFVRADSLDNRLTLVKNTLDEAAARSSRRQSLALGILATLLLVLVVGNAFALKLAISKRLAILDAGTKRIGSGDLDFRIEIRTNDELGDLGRAMNEMAAKLHDSYASRDELGRIAAELRRSNEELEQFAYIASHDLQEPLRSIASFLQLVERRYRERLDDEGREFIGFAVAGANRLQTMIEGLLAYSRVGKRAAAPAPVDLGRALAKALENLTAALAEAGAVVTCDPLPTVTGDEDQLVQLFQNLVGNAVKHRGAAPPQVHVSCRRDPEGPVVMVRDNGIGIAPEHQRRIFEIFRRLQGPAVPGAGIGLAICRRIVERAGGRIWVESEPGRGAIFAFTLPNADKGSSS